MSNKPADPLLLDLTAQIVSAHVSHNPIAADALPPLITSVLRTLSEAGSAAGSEKREPAVAVNKSAFANYIVCLECGKHFSVLKRHLRTDHSLTPEAYREKWGLNRLYPFVAPDYAKRRSALAKQIGLGTKPPAGRAVVKRGRPKKVA